MASTTDASEAPLPTENGDKRNRLPVVTIGLTLVAVAALLALVFGGGSNDAVDADGLTNIVFVNPDGSEGTLADYDGEPLVVNFFAAWCAPCKAELPDIEEVFLAADNDVTIVGISHDLDRGVWQGLVDETGITFPTVWQAGQEIYRDLDLFGMPSTAFITADGEVAHTFSGPLDATKLRELINEHLNVNVKA